MISKLYAPEKMGIFFSCFAISGLICMFSDLKFSELIILDNDKTIKNLDYKISLLLGLSIGLILTPILLSFNFYDNWLIIACGTFITISHSFFNTSINWNISHSNFKKNAVLKVLQTFIEFLLQVSFSIFGTVGLFISRGISQSVLSVFEIRKNIKNSIFPFSYKVAVSRIKSKKKYASSYSLTSALNHLSNNFFQFTFPLTFGVDQLGLVAFSTKILFGPFAIIASGLQQVFFKEFTKQDFNHHSFLIKFYSLTLPLGLASILLIWNFAEPMIQVFFNSTWYGAIEYIRFLSPYFIMLSINSCVSSIYLVKNKIKEMNYMESAISGVKYLSIFIIFLSETSIPSMIKIISFILIIIELSKTTFFIMISKKVINA